MAVTIGRVRSVWTGFTGAPGVSTFYATDPLSAVAPIRTFFNALVGLLPSSVRIQVNGSGDMLDDTTGNLVGTFSSANPAVVVGTGGASYPGPVGSCVDLLTGSVIGRRRVMGRCFLVPLQSAAFDTDGTLTAAALSTISGAATALAASFASAGFMVWHRPKNNAGGAAVAALSTRVPDLAAVLRSRRD